MSEWTLRISSIISQGGVLLAGLRKTRVYDLVGNDDKAGGFSAGLLFAGGNFITSTSCRTAIRVGSEKRGVPG